MTTNNDAVYTIVRNALHTAICAKCDLEDAIEELSALVHKLKQDEQPKVEPAFDLDAMVLAAKGRVHNWITNRVSTEQFAYAMRWARTGADQENVRLYFGGRGGGGKTLSRKDMLNQMYGLSYGKLGSGMQRPPLAINLEIMA